MISSNAKRLHCAVRIKYPACYTKEQSAVMLAASAGQKFTQSATTSVIVK